MENTFHSSVLVANANIKQSITSYGWILYVDEILLMVNRNSTVFVFILFIQKFVLLESILVIFEWIVPLIGTVCATSLFFDRNHVSTFGTWIVWIEIASVATILSYVWCTSGICVELVFNKSGTRISVPILHDSCEPFQKDNAGDIHCVTVKNVYESIPFSFWLTCVVPFFHRLPKTYIESFEEAFTVVRINIHFFPT